MKGTTLRELVAERVSARWESFAAEHPHLAASIDRVRLIDDGVLLVRGDAAFRQAVRDADLDDAQLVQAARALRRVEDLVQLVMPR
jgi:hypothetical protein